MNRTMPIVDPMLIEPEARRRLIVETLQAIRRCQRDQPDRWAQIEARADEIRAERSGK